VPSSVRNCTISPRVHTRGAHSPRRSVPLYQRGASPNTSKKCLETASQLWGSTYRMWVSSACPTRGKGGDIKTWKASPRTEHMRPVATRRKRGVLRLERATASRTCARPSRDSSGPCAWERAHAALRAPDRRPPLCGPHALPKPRYRPLQSLVGSIPVREGVWHKAGDTLNRTAHPTHEAHGHPRQQISRDDLLLTCTSDRRLQSVSQRKARHFPRARSQTGQPALTPLVRVVRLLVDKVRKIWSHREGMAVSPEARQRARKGRRAQNRSQHRAAAWSARTEIGWLWPDCRLHWQTW